MEIWVNPACSKCRAATSALDEAGIDYTVRRYLDDPPGPDELRAVLDRLHLEPWHVARTTEKVAAEIGLTSISKDESGRERWIEALVEHPILIQRPIITADDGTTVVGRDPGALDTVIAAERTPT
jgi:arsenate reductase (glutaredoxin)